MKVRLLSILFGAAVLAAEPHEIEPLRSKQGEVSGSVAYSIYSSVRNAKYVGVNVSAGRSLTNHFTLLSEFNRTSITGVARTSYEGSARVNITTRGRLIPYVVATTGSIRTSVFSVHQQGFGVGVGGGIMLRASNHVETKCEMKQNNIVTLGGVILSHRYPAVSIGVGYRFDKVRYRVRHK